MNYKSRREKLYQKLDSEGYLLLCSGFEVHRSADENYPFSVNRNFFYLTGIDQKDSFLVVNLKTKEEKLFLLNTDPILERWIGAYLDFEKEFPWYLKFIHFPYWKKHWKKFFLRKNYIWI